MCGNGRALVRYSQAYLKTDETKTIINIMRPVVTTGSTEFKKKVCRFKTGQLIHEITQIRPANLRLGLRFAGLAGLQSSLWSSVTLGEFVHFPNA